MIYVQYAFNSHTFKNDPISIPFGGEKVSQVTYEPRSKRILLWTKEGTLKYYKLHFKTATNVT